jgi:hypothetical protein
VKNRRYVPERLTVRSRFTEGAPGQFRKRPSIKLRSPIPEINQSDRVTGVVSGGTVGDDRVGLLPSGQLTLFAGG